MIASGAPLRVLVIDDEPPIRKFLHTTLTAAGYSVVEAADGEEAVKLAGRNAFSLLLLDLGLPGMSGFDVITALRAQGNAVPIVILSSRNDETGKVKALDLGADDYVTKPFGIQELLARMRAALRHQLQSGGEPAIFRSGDLVVDIVRRIVTIKGNEVRLTPREYDLLRLLVAHAGKVLTHRMMVDQVWVPGTDLAYLRLYIARLRQKIEADPQRPTLIMTEQGVGYRLREDSPPT